MTHVYGALAEMTGLLTPCLRKLVMIVHMMTAFLEGKNGKCKASQGLSLEPNNAISILLVKTSPRSRSEEIDFSLAEHLCPF